MEVLTCHLLSFTDFVYVLPLKLHVKMLNAIVDPCVTNAEFPLKIVDISCEKAGERK